MIVGQRGSETRSRQSHEGKALGERYGAVVTVRCRGINFSAGTM